MNSGGWTMSFTCSTTGDSQTASRTSGPGLIHLLYMILLLKKLRKQTSVTGIGLTRRGRILQPANPRPLSRGPPTRNHILVRLQNLASPPGPHHRQLPTKPYQPCRPCHGHWPRRPTPIKICPLSSDQMASSFLKRRNGARNLVSAFTTASRTIAHLLASTSPTLQRLINQLAPPTRLNPRAVRHKPKPRNQTPSRRLLPMPRIFSTQPCWRAGPLRSR